MNSTKTVSRRSFGTFSFKKDSSPREYALAVLRKYLTEAFKHERGAKEFKDSEYIHDMRVALRKFRTALAIFKSYLPKETQGLRDALDPLLTALGEVRDLDVQISSMKKSLHEAGNVDKAGAKELLASFKSKLHDARINLLAVFDSNKYEETLVAWKDFLDLQKKKPEPENGKTIDEIYEKMVQARTQAFFKHGDRLKKDSKATDFHAVRILGKKLRYTLEFFHPIQKERIDQIIKKMSKIQDFLGDINDCRVAHALLRSIAKSKNHEFLPIALFEMGRLAMFYEVQEQEGRKEFLEEYEQIDWVRHPWG